MKIALVLNFSMEHSLKQEEKPKNLNIYGSENFSCKKFPGQYINILLYSVYTQFIPSSFPVLSLLRVPGLLGSFLKLACSSFPEQVPSRFMQKMEKFKNHHESKSHVFFSSENIPLFLIRKYTIVCRTIFCN
jgi:hypothetical protein